MIDSVRNGLFHSCKQLFHGPTFCVLSDWTCAQERTGLDWNTVFLLQINKWFDVVHERANRCSRTNLEIVIDDMSDHCFDVFEVEWARSGQTQIDFLHAEVFHEGQQLNFLFDGWITSARTLQTIAQSFIIKPHSMGVICGISSNIVLNRIPIVYQ